MRTQVIVNVEFDTTSDMDISIDIDEESAPYEVDSRQYSEKDFNTLIRELRNAKRIYKTKRLD